jgi:hypothetical protein
MAFPTDLSNVIVFKIHPAIGIARLSRNDDYFVFGEDPGTYKSNGMMKRQAVQFRIYAYGENHVGLGELTPTLMNTLGLTAVWSARVGNRKIARRKGVPPSASDFVVSATASSNANGGRLVGRLPGYDEGGSIPLGEIRSDGVFVPPKADVFRKKAGEALPSFPGSERFSDNSSDGEISARLTKGAQAFDVLPACIVVCGHDYSPDTDPDSSLVDYFKEQLQIPANAPPGNLHNQAARALDEAALRSATDEFDPGIEMSLEENTEVPSVKAICYASTQDSRVDPREARIRYKPALTDAGPGAVPGQLTSGLCSPWQSDYMACVGFWKEHLPAEIFLNQDDPTMVRLVREHYADHTLGSPTGPGTLQTADDFADGMDEVGVVRLRAGKKVETERGPGDDIPKPMA